MRLLGALAAGLIYSFLTPIFIPLFALFVFMQYLAFHGYAWEQSRRIAWRALDVIDGAGLILSGGLCVVAAVSAGFVAARIARDIPYAACSLLIAINVTICAVVMRGLPEWSRTAFLVGGSVCVIVGGYLSDRGLLQIVKFLGTRGMFRPRASR